MLASNKKWIRDMLRCMHDLTLRAEHGEVFDVSKTIYDRFPGLDHEFVEEFCLQLRPKVDENRYHSYVEE